MSSRRRDNPVQDGDADRLRAELGALKNSQASADAAGTLAEQQVDQGATLTFDQLNTTEQSAASLGVHPDDWKPIKCARSPFSVSLKLTRSADRRFMNNAHFSTLLKNNALDDELARRIEAFRTVAAGQ